MLPFFFRTCICIYPVCDGINDREGSTPNSSLWERLFSFLWLFVLFTMSRYSFYRRKRNFFFFLVKSITKAMRKNEIQEVVCLGKAGVALGGLVVLLVLYFLTLVSGGR